MQIKEERVCSALGVRKVQVHYSREEMPQF